MQKQFLSNISITLFTNILVKPIWILGIDRVFQNRLGLEDYGAYTNVFTFSLILGLLLDFGINNYNAASLARNPQLLSTQFASLSFIKMGLGIGYIVLTLLAGFLYGFRGDLLWLLFVLCVNQCLTYTSTFLRSTLTGLQLYRTDAIISTVDRLAMIVAGASILVYTIFPVTVETFVYIQTFGYAIAVGISLLTLLPKLNQIEFRFNIAEIKPVFRQALPFAVLAFIMTMYARFDVLMIKKILPNGDYENGIYVQSTRLLDAVNMVAVLVSGMLLPMFSAMLRKQESVTALVKLAMVVLWVPCIMGVVFCNVYANEIMSLLYHESNPYHAKVLQICMASVLPMCMMYVFGTLLTADMRLRILIQTAAIALLVNIVGNYWLIPQMGAEGAAWVALCSYLIVGVGNTITAMRVLPITLSFQYFRQFVVLLILCYSALCLMKYAEYHFAFVVVVYGFFSIILVWILKIVDTDTIKKALKIPFAKG